MTYRRVTIMALAAIVGGSVAWWQLRGGGADNESPGAQRTAREERAKTTRTPLAERRERELRRLPPRLRVPSPESVQDVPLPDEYDPILLSASSFDIFEAEPHDSNWAPRMEERMGLRATADLDEIVPDARVVRVECRTSSCQLEVEVAAPGFDDVNFLLQVPALADRIQVRRLQMEDGTWLFTATYLLSKEHRNFDVYDAWYAHRRASALQAREQVREHGLRLPKK